jgi:hypothetical protein
MTESVDRSVPPTGDEAVDAAVTALGRIDDDTSLEQQVAVLDEVHQALQHRLTATQG